MEHPAVTSRPIVIGLILKEIRTKKGFSVYGAADLTGFETETIQSMENEGDAELYRFVRYARLMGVSFLTVIDLAEKAEQNLINAEIEVVDYCDPKYNYFCSLGKDEDTGRDRPSINDFIHVRR